MESFPNWFYWSLAILTAYPILAISIAELRTGMERTRLAPFSAPLEFCRRFLLPALFLMLLMRKVVEFHDLHIAMRLADTLFWILAINFALSILNIFFFTLPRGRGAIRAPKLLLDIIRVFVVALAAAVVISTIWGIDLAKLLAAFGVGSIVIGLALQDTLGSLFAGLALVSSGQKRVGDWVYVAGEEGVIENLNWRAVTIRTLKGDQVVVPNSMVAKDQFVLLGGDTGRLTGQRTVTFEHLLAYEHPPQQVLDLLVANAAASDGVVEDPPPEAFLLDYENEGVRYLVQATIDDMDEVDTIRNNVLANLWYAAQREGIIFPAQHHAFYRLPPAARTARSFSAAELARQVADVGALPRTEEQILPLMQSARWQRYRVGEILVRPDGEMRDVFIVIDGIVEALEQDEADSPVAALFGRGQFIVFKSILRSATCPFELRARTDVSAVAIPTMEFKNYLATDSELSSELEQVIDALEAVTRRVRVREPTRRRNQGRQPQPTRSL